MWKQIFDTLARRSKHSLHMIDSTIVRAHRAAIGAAALSDLCDRAQHFNGSPDEQYALFDSIKAEYTSVRTYLSGRISGGVQ